MAWHWPDTALFHLAGSSRVLRKATDLHIYGPSMQRLAELVGRVTQPGEILWSNAPYAGGLVAALAQRPTSSAMFYEVPPRHAFDPVGAARWILWFKIDLPDAPPLEALVRRYRLRLAADDAMAWVFEHPNGSSTQERPRAVIPLWFATMLLCGALGVVVWDFRPKQER